MHVYQRMSCQSQWGTMVAVENVSVLQQLTQTNSCSKKVGRHLRVSIKKPSCLLHFHTLTFQKHPKFCLLNVFLFSLFVLEYGPHQYSLFIGSDDAGMGSERCPCVLGRGWDAAVYEFTTAIGGYAALKKSLQLTNRDKLHVTGVKREAVAKLGRQWGQRAPPAS